MRKRLLMLLVTLSSSTVSCAVSPPDVPVCIELALDRGYCIKTLSSEEFVVDEHHRFAGKTWWEHRPYMLRVPASSWAEIKKFIIEVCKASNQCDAQITSWQRTVNQIDKNLPSQEKDYWE